MYEKHEDLLQKSQLVFKKSDDEQLKEPEYQVKILTHEEMEMLKEQNGAGQNKFINGRI